MLVVASGPNKYEWRGGRGGRDHDNTVIQWTVIAQGLGLMLPKGMFYEKLIYYRVTCDQQGHMAI